MNNDERKRMFEKISKISERLEEISIRYNRLCCLCTDSPTHASEASDLMLKLTESVGKMALGGSQQMNQVLGMIGRALADPRQCNELKSEFWLKPGAISKTEAEKDD